MSSPTPYPKLWRMVAFWARLELRWRSRLELDARRSLGRVRDLQMVWIAAGVSDTQISRKVMLQIHSVWDLPLAGIIKKPVGLQLLVAGVRSAVSRGVSGAPELPNIRFPAEPEPG